MSKALKDYKDRVFFKGTTKAAYVDTKTKESIEDLVTNSQYRADVRINKKTTTDAIALMATQEAQEFEIAKVIAPLGLLSVGDIFSWQEEEWLVVREKFRTRQPGFNGDAIKTNNILKWIDADGALHVLPAYLRTKVANSSLSVTQEERGRFQNVMILEDNIDIMAATPFHVGLRTGMRFIFKGQAFRIMNVDNIAIENISILSLTKDFLSKDDDVEEGIAYNTDYSLILNFELPVYITVGDTLENIITVLKSGQLVEEEYSLISSDKEIVKVLTGNVLSGLDEGTVQITASLVKNPLVNLTFSVTGTAEEEPQTNVVTILGKDYIAWNTTNQYELNNSGEVAYSVSTDSKIKYAFDVVEGVLELSIEDRHGGIIEIRATDVDTEQEYTKHIRIVSV